MSRIHSRSDKRAAFTLVELMVVILIIAILASLVSVGVVNVMSKIPETQTRVEISDMEKALAAFMADFDLTDPPPSVLTLDPLISSYPAGDPSLVFLTKMFGKNLGSQGAITWGPGGGGTLTGEQCLVFYLGGINNQGFSFNKMNPTPVAGQKTHGPYFTFQSSRLVVPAGTTFPVYIDPWQAKAGPFFNTPATNFVTGLPTTMNGTPYAYFSSQGINNNPAYPFSSILPSLVPPGYTAAPYFTAAGQYTNPNTYQIISAGKNGIFGTSGWIPSSGATGVGADDQANFSAKVLGVGQQ